MKMRTAIDGARVLEISKEDADHIMIYADGKSVDILFSTPDFYDTIPKDRIDIDDPKLWAITRNGRPLEVNSYIIGKQSEK